MDQQEPLPDLGATPARAAEDDWEARFGALAEQLGESRPEPQPRSDQPRSVQPRSDQPWSDQPWPSRQGPRPDEPPATDLPPGPPPASDRGPDRPPPPPTWLHPEQAPQERRDEPFGGPYGQDPGPAPAGHRAYGPEPGQGPTGPPGPTARGGGYDPEPDRDPYRPEPAGRGFAGPQPGQGPYGPQPGQGPYGPQPGQGPYGPEPGRRSAGADAGTRAGTAAGAGAETGGRVGSRGAARQAGTRSRRGRPEDPRQAAVYDALAINEEVLDEVWTSPSVDVLKVVSSIVVNALDAYEDDPAEYADWVAVHRTGKCDCH